MIHIDVIECQMSVMWYFSWYSLTLTARPCRCRTSAWAPGLGATGSSGATTRSKTRSCVKATAADESCQQILTDPNSNDFKRNH